MANSVLVLRLLEILGDGEPLGVSELARAADASKSSTHRALEDLADSGWVHDVGRESRRWALTPKVLVVAAGVGGESGIRNSALDEMEVLRDELGETVHLSVPDGHEMVLVERLDTPKEIRYVLPLGSRGVMHLTATGMAYLAGLPDDARTELARRSLQYGPRELRPRAVDLVAALDAARNCGYAFNRAGYRHDIVAVAACVRDATGRPAASLSISVPQSRTGDVDIDAIASRVVDAAASISFKLGFR